MICTNNLLYKGAGIIIKLGGVLVFKNDKNSGITHYLSGPAIADMTSTFDYQVGIYNIYQNLI